MVELEQAWSQGYGLGYRRGVADRHERGEEIAISLDLVEAAVRLCHPDRHPEQRFGQANAVTRDLNALADRIRATAQERT